MRILGIDPGSRLTGFGIIDLRGRETHYIASGCVRVRSQAMAERLREIFDGVSEVVDTYAPEVLAVEQVFVRVNVSSALKLGQARGVAIVAGVARALPVFEYTPAQVKQAVVGHGRAAKEQVQHMVRSLLKLPGNPQADAADALAVALCHVQMQGSPYRQAARQGTARRAR